jgi:protein TonB
VADGTVGGEGDWNRDYVGPDFNAGYLSNPEPEYPFQSRRLREQGLVKLRVHVTAEGRADEVTLHLSSGYDRLDRAALDAVRRWRFRPARRAGTPVAGWVVVPVRFELQS